MEDFSGRSVVGKCQGLDWKSEADWGPGNGYASTWPEGAWHFVVMG